MIANPNVRAYRYDPYPKILSIEKYDFLQMISIRKKAIEKAKQAQIFGIILGTLGRQGNPQILDRFKCVLQKQGKKYMVLLLSEIFPEKLKQMEQHIDAWIQIACPRLSIDWGYAFHKPLLSPFEANVVLFENEGPLENNTIAFHYPMDFYAKESAGTWTNYYQDVK
jgi:2-(3-amino-3-carboxypropyl)histidine synthase